jgi:hypothetical protein
MGNHKVFIQNFIDSTLGSLPFGRIAPATN